MVKRYGQYIDRRGMFIDQEDFSGKYVKYEDYQELEAENARLRQQRDAANAQLDFILENKE